MTPMVLDSNISDTPYIKLEYIKHPTLAELWLYGDFPPDFWIETIHDLFSIIHKFRRYNENVTKDEYHSIYLEKTVQRIDELIKNNELFKEILIILFRLTISSKRKYMLRLMLINDIIVISLRRMRLPVLLRRAVNVGMIFKQHIAYDMIFWE